MSPSLNIPILDASNIDLCLQYIGRKVQIVGKAHEIVYWDDSFGKEAPNININLGDFHKRIVKVIIPKSIVAAKGWGGELQAHGRVYGSLQWEHCLTVLRATPIFERGTLP